MNIVEPVSIYKVQEVLASSQISDNEKAKFIRNNQAQIQKFVDIKVASHEYSAMMKGRPLQKFKPIKNSFTKRGDKILLANALGIAPSEVDDYIEGLIFDIENGIELSPNQLELLRTYVYRHGKKSQLVSVLDYELGQTGDILGYLYRTLEYNSGGIADYFVRPIHRMDNKTLAMIYKAIDKNMDDALVRGDISIVEKRRTAEWALLRICQIQNNSKFIGAIKTYKNLK